MQITKIVHGIGNGGHIYLPKEMVGQKVIVNSAEKTLEDIEEEALHILKPYLKNIQGVYLCGSYARGEQAPGSDIDILVVTDGRAMIRKRINEYDIMSLSLEQLEKTIGFAAVLILPMLREARPILNQGLIEKYRKERLTKENTRWYIETTESSLKLAKFLVDDKAPSNIPYAVYPLIMRLRGLYIIESLINGKECSNREVIKYIVKKGVLPAKAEQLYRVYREHRDGKTISENSISYDDIYRLYNIVLDYFQRVRILWARLR